MKIVLGSRTSTVAAATPLPIPPERRTPTRRESIDAPNASKGARLLSRFNIQWPITHENQNEAQIRNRTPPFTHPVGPPVQPAFEI
jgi:hypothetical protein